MTSFQPTFQFNIGELQAAVKEARDEATSSHIGQGHKILDGRTVSRAALEQVQRAAALLKARGISPRLAVVRVGDDPASEIYVRHKIRACEKVQILSDHVHLPADISQADLLGRLVELNRDASVHGILVQLPLSAHHSAQACIEQIAPTKDVDGFHPLNMGCLMVGQTDLEPCTPRGIMTLLAAYGVKIAGKHAVVVGRSMIVGRPMTQMLLRANATVTACHQYTQNLAGHVRQADILVVATGVAKLIKPDWIKPGAVIADVGMTRLADGKLQGDVDFEGAREHASLITPVPGGVGPMTVATLLENTIRATLGQHQLRLEDTELVSTLSN